MVFLYVTGHDKRELYVLDMPVRGDILTHVATIETVTSGQAIGWDQSMPRVLWSIERSAASVVGSVIPKVELRSEN
nr:hypothetical protein [uncultured Sphingorhabdus sp.]